MNVEFIDVQSLSAICTSVSELTGLSFSIYDGMGGVLSSHDSDDRLLAQITSYRSGREEYDTFIRKGIAKAAIRNDTSVLKGPADQNYLFIPINLSNLIIVLVSSPFYFEKTDLSDFLGKNGPRYGLSLSNLESLSEIVRVKDYGSVQKITAPVKLLLETVFKASYERNLNHKRYQWTKTLIDVLFNIKLPVPTEELYALVLDAILFLFSVDTAAVMVRERNIYKTVMASGRLKGDVSALCVKDNEFMSQSIESSRLASTNDINEVTKLGFPDSITSVQVFPRINSDSTYGAVLIYNSVISREESYSILEFLKLVNLVLKNLSLQNSYNKCIRDVEVLNAIPAKLNAKFHDPEALHEEIVNTAIGLVKAEKGSLMLAENGTLSIKAIKGINRWLAQDITVKVGEGVAGKVFVEGKPLLAKDIDALVVPHAKPRHHYKTGSFISVPLLFDEKPMGVLNVSDKLTGEEFTELDVTLLSYLSSFASMALKMSSYHNLAEQMKELSITDPVTGLFNRRYLQERFTEELHRSERHNLTFSFIIFDIDDFKLFNDTEGHLAGDAILQHVARIAHANSRVHDVVCRYGGEEFSVLLPQTGKDEALLVAERMRKSIKETLTTKWERFPRNYISVSMGVSSYPEDGETVDDMIKCADTALYKAKASGKDRTLSNFRQNRREL